MTRKFSIVFVFIILLGFSPVDAQEYRVEITGFGGYTFSEGIDVDSTEVDEGIVITKITPSSGVSYGFQFDVALTSYYAVGFLFSQQDSTLEGSVKGQGKTDFTDMAVRNYHFMVTYNALMEEDMVRPTVFLGIGATQYSPSDIDGRSVSSTTKFSFCLGGGVKIFPSEHIGFRFTGRWTPTYINSTNDGYWCGWYPYGYTCWGVGNANYSHALELAGGLIVRF